MLTQALLNIIRIQYTVSVYAKLGYNSRENQIMRFTGNPLTDQAFSAEHDSSLRSAGEKTVIIASALTKPVPLVITANAWNNGQLH